MFMPGGLLGEEERREEAEGEKEAHGEGTD
jgi:hypothetical protein